MTTQWLNVKLDKVILNKLSIMSKTCQKCMIGCVQPKCKKI